MRSPIRKTSAPPIVTPVTATTASRLSPWPGRLKRGWRPERLRRTDTEILREYDDGPYARLPLQWKQFWHSPPRHGRHIGAALRFLDVQRNERNAALKDLPEVYGDVDLQRYLVSINDRLYAADLNLFESWWRSFIVQRVDAVRAVQPFDWLVEMGCGPGASLVEAYARAGLNGIAGCDLSPNAIRFLRELARDTQVPSKFSVGDYRDWSVIEKLAPARAPWALMSVHAIEQAHELPIEWFIRAVNGRNPPRVVMHFEPVVWDRAQGFAKDCARYAELNLYNKTLLRALRQAERAKLIDIVHVEKRVIGHTAHNPTSLIVWAPRPTRRSRTRRD